MVVAGGQGQDGSPVAQVCKLGRNDLNISFKYFFLSIQKYLKFKTEMKSKKCTMIKIHTEKNISWANFLLLPKNLHYTILSNEEV